MDYYTKQLEDLPNAIKHKRQSQKIEQETIAKETGLSKFQICRAEQGIVGNFNVWYKMSKWVGSPIDFPVDTDKDILEAVKELINNDPQITDKNMLFNIFEGMYNGATQ